MTRIAAGIGASNQPSIDNSDTHAAGAAEDVRTRTGAPGTQVRGLPGDIGPDRPAPQSGVGQKAPTLDARAFVADLCRWEGENRFMYLDTKGNVTTGVGHLVKDAKAALDLPWYNRSTGRRATPVEVDAAFARLREMWTAYRSEHPKGKNPHSAQYYENKSDLVLPEGYATKLAIDRLQNEFLPALQKMFPGLDRYPMPAQRALVDMAYNLGVGKLVQKFPAFARACRAGDFATAAAECERSSSRQKRNDVTRKLLDEAAQLNASVRTLPREVRL